MVFWKTIFVTVLMLSLLFSYNTVFAQNVYCTMVCNDNLNISVGNQCSVTIRYDQIMEDADNSYTCTPNGPQAFKIEVMDEDLKVLPTSPTIPYEYVGRTLTVKVKHWATGNNCWSTITLQDKIPPKLVCPADITVPCTQSTEPAITGMATVSDCGSGSTVTYEDVYTNLDCADPIGKITRIWTAEDMHGNKSKCSQIISIARPNIHDVSFPSNKDGITDAAVSCVEVNANSNRTQPEFTGYPTLHGKPITTLTGEVCKLNANFEDQIIDACSGSYKILRKWSVLNWCTSELREGIQIIKVADKTPPTIQAPADMTIGTQTTGCFANVPLLPATVSDACSDNVSVKIRSPFSTIDGNGGNLLEVPVGTHLITYEAVDACGNQASATMKLTVEDDDPPVVVCNDETVVSLTSDGTALVYAASFDGGSHDNCCLKDLTVRRMGAENFGPSVEFACEDSEVMVELKATDCHGNENTCMVNVRVQDKVAPTLVCPGDRTIDCESDYSDLTIFGHPQIIDNCGFEIIESVVEELDNCGVGTIKRTWTAKGTGGENTSCTQTITVVNQNPWNPNNDQIIWPKDYETTECMTTTALAPDDLPEGFNKPTFKGDNNCSLVATNHKDLVLDVEPPACFKILRTWTVIDWCQYDPNAVNDRGRYEYTQVIKVSDNTDPVFGVVPTDITIDLTEEGCAGTVTLPDVGVSDCNPNATVTAQGALGNGFGPFTNVTAGVYDMKYIATDGCGNSTTQAIKVTVRDGKKPTPICIDGLVITLMPAANGNPAMVDLWATDLNAKSFDNCTAEDDLTFRIRARDTAQTTAPSTDKITFTCDNLGSQQVEVWVIDANGNADYCITTVEVQDNQKVCGEGMHNTPMIALSGKITTQSGAAVEEVKVQITHPDKTPYVTGTDGTFSYEQLPGNLDYALIPEKKIEPTNGVTTLDIIKMRKHLLGKEYFDTPYKLIAADVDQSGVVSTLDLIQTRKLLLGLIDEFPNNESWRFVAKSYQFDENGAPLHEDFPEIAIIPKDSRSKSDVDFIAIKVGDVDFDASPNGLQKSQGRNAAEALFFDVENQEFVAGEIVNVIFRSNKFNAVLGYQFELNFNPEIMEFQTFKNAALDKMTVNNLGLKQVEKGRIRASWDNREGQTLADDKALFSFQFKAKKAGNLKELLHVTRGALQPQIYTDNEATYALKLNFKEELKTTEKVADKAELAQNEPNPFHEQTNIRFTLPKAQQASLTIFNGQGTVLKEYKGRYSKGTHTIHIKRQDFAAAGLVFYTLETEDTRIMKKMLIID
jgi:hypothetical protein